MAAHFPDEELQQKYSGTTVLATDRVLNIVAVVQEALAIYQLNHIQEPPSNTSFRIIWFPQKIKIAPYRTFVLFKRSAPPELKNTHLWNCSILEDVIDGTQGDYLSTKDSLNIAMFRRSFLPEVTIYTEQTQVGMKKLTKSQHPEYNSFVHLEYYERLFIHSFCIT